MRPHDCTPHDWRMYVQNVIFAARGDRFLANIPSTVLDAMRDGMLEELKAHPSAEAYRWLRRQQWDTSPLCVVANPKQAVKLGYDCPSGDRLDAAIVAAMSAEAPVVLEAPRTRAAFDSPTWLTPALRAKVLRAPRRHALRLELDCDRAAIAAVWRAFQLGDTVLGRPIMSVSHTWPTGAAVIVVLGPEAGPVRECA